MNKLSEIVKAMPEMLSGSDLIEALMVLPDYDVSVLSENAAIRLMALADVYRVYIPSQMSLEIYSKLYLALLRSLQKKGTRLAIQQQNENRKAILNQNYTGIMGGSDSFTIIGASGIGKSSAISRAIELIAGNQVIEVNHPHTMIIPVMVVQCPFDSSVKGLLLEILRKVDEVLESNFYSNAVRARATTDMLIGSVSQVALNHIGLLIVDEIQNVVNSKQGKSLVGMLTQLINNSGISICMVGTPESAVFFEQAMQLARRSLGLSYGAMEYGDDFYETCRILFKYQFLKNPTEITDGIVAWLYEHSAGIISVVVSLIHDAQEIAILSGKETLDLEVLDEAYRKRLSLLHGYLEASHKPLKQSTTAAPKEIVSDREESEVNIDFTIASLAAKAKEESLDMISLLKTHHMIEVIAV